MKAGNITLERLKQTVTDKSGCTPLYLKVLKSDLHRLLKQYMRLDDIDFSVQSMGDAHNLIISVIVTEFFDLGRSE